MTDQTQQPAVQQAPPQPEATPAAQPAADAQAPGTQAQAAEPKRPAAELREGALKAAIWRNDGEHGAYHTVNLARTYKDDQGAYHDTASFRAKDLLPLAELARQAHYRTQDLNREAFKEQRREDVEPAASKARDR